MIAVKEHPIIFNTENVKLILGGIKTQTRRVMKPQPREWLTDDAEPSGWSWGGGTKKSDLLGTDIDGIKAWCPLFCPYGQVGDRLWGRETFCHYCYKSDGIEDACYKEDMIRNEMTCKNMVNVPSIFMPRWASRISLEITKVRVERV